ncbi:MAG: hypothetical protein R2827_00215 [Bdellovibrionales bacterium]
MLDAFYQSKVPFEVAILNFKDNLNIHDTKFIREKSEQLNLKIHLVDLDIIDFFESGKYFEYGEKYACQSPQLAAHMWLMDQLDGVPILSGNFTFPIINGNELFWVGTPGDLHCSYFRYFEKTQRQGEPWFFLNSTEVTASILNLEEIRSFLFRDRFTEEIEYNFKILAYKVGGFQVTPQEKKTTGFELVRDFYDKKIGTKWGQGFNQMFRKPLELLNPFPDVYLQYNPINTVDFSDQHIHKNKTIQKFINRIFLRS